MSEHVLVDCLIDGEWETTFVDVNDLIHICPHCLCPVETEDAICPCERRMSA